MDMANHLKLMVVGLVALTAAVFTLMGVLLSSSLRTTYPYSNVPKAHHTSLVKVVKSMPGKSIPQGMLRYTERLNIRLRGLPVHKVTTVGSSVTFHDTVANYTDDG